MTDYRELHYAGDVTAGLVPGEPLGWDSTQRPYVIVQAWYEPPTAGPAWTEVGATVGGGRAYVAPVGTPAPLARGRTTVVLQHASPEQVRGWIDSGQWQPELMDPRTPDRVRMLFAAHRAELRAAAAK